MAVVAERRRFSNRLRVCAVPRGEASSSSLERGREPASSRLGHLWFVQAPCGDAKWHKMAR
eukprot:11217842-Lingulodinium_polyedra.AAC.1